MLKLQALPTALMEILNLEVVVLDDIADDIARIGFCFKLWSLVMGRVMCIRTQCYTSSTRQIIGLLVEFVASFFEAINNLSPKRRVKGAWQHIEWQASTAQMTHRNTQLPQIKETRVWNRKLYGNAKVQN